MSLFCSCAWGHTRRLADALQAQVAQQAGTGLLSCVDTRPRAAALAQHCACGGGCRSPVSCQLSGPQCLHDQHCACMLSSCS